MIVKTLFHDLQVEIETPDQEIREMLKNAKPLIELGIFDALFQLTIRATDGSKFESPEGDKETVTVLSSSLTFEFNSSRAGDLVHMAELNALQMSALHSALYRYPGLAAKWELKYQIKILSLYLISFKHANQALIETETWTDQEHTAQTWRDYNFGD